MYRLTLKRCGAMPLPTKDEVVVEAKAKIEDAYKSAAEKLESRKKQRLEELHKELDEAVREFASRVG